MVLQTFIVFEGLDGTGTSTQINLLKNKLPKEKTVFTCEPTDSETGKFLRKMLKADVKVDPKTAAFLFAADRCEHVYGKDGIVENCLQGKTVISDRYLFSSLAYQSLECGEELPYKLNEDFPLPGILFFFEMPPEKSLERVQKRAQSAGEATEIYEKIEIQKKTYRAYQDVLKHFSSPEFSQMKIVRIDASLSIEKIHEGIMRVIEDESGVYRL